MQVYGVIGDPVEHSLSPPMHRAAFKSLGIDADYSRFRVRKGNVKNAIKGSKSLGIDGLNITVPHKETVANLSEIEKVASAKEIGAINTLDLHSMKGYNTDVIGARKALEKSGTKIKNKKVVIVGAGGAARAVAYGLADKALSLDIINRTAEKAIKLAEEIGDKAKGHSLEYNEELIVKADIVVNATSVGMKEEKSPFPVDYLHSNLTVFDLVYRPIETHLLREAKKRGAKTVDGVSMLVLQGAESLDIWTGEKPPIEVMEKKIRNIL